MAVRPYGVGIAAGVEARSILQVPILVPIRGRRIRISSRTMAKMVTIISSMLHRRRHGSRHHLVLLDSRADRLLLPACIILTLRRRHLMLSHPSMGMAPSTNRHNRLLDMMELMIIGAAVTVMVQVVARLEATLGTKEFFQ